MDVEDAIGAGDQGMMFGYATNETQEYMPLPIALAHRLARRLAEVRKNGTLPYLRPDGKTQVTILYEDNKPVAVDTIVISTQHDENISLEQIRKDLIEHVIKAIVPAGCCAKIRASSSIRRANSLSAARRVIRDSRAARLSSTPTAAGLVTAVALSQARIPRR